MGQYCFLFWRYLPLHPWNFDEQLNENSFKYTDMKTFTNIIAFLAGRCYFSF